MFEYDEATSSDITGLRADPWDLPGSDIDWSLAEPRSCPGCAGCSDCSGSAAGPEPAELLADSLASSPAQRSTRALATLDPGELTEDQRIDQLQLLEEQIRWLSAARVRVLAAIEADDVPGDHLDGAAGLGLAAEAVALTLRMPVGAAQTKLKASRTLVEDLPATLALLAAGRVCERRANLIAEASWAVPAMKVADFEARVATRASEQTTSQLARSVRRAVLAADPSGAERRHQQARTERGVRLIPAYDGMAELRALLPAVDAEAAFTRLDAATDLLPACDPRTRDQQRADLLVDGLLTGIPAEAIPQRQGRRPAVQVVVSADTLLGLDEQPGHLTGYGPITAGQARQAAADASGTWLRLLTDPDSGALLDATPETYEPSRHLTEFLLARDEVCVHPTCSQPGWRCDIEHLEPFDHDDPKAGGQTTTANTALVCRRHHRLKTAGEHSYRKRPDGGVVWTDHTDHDHIGHPPDRWGEPARPERAAPHPPDADPPF